MQSEAKKPRVQPTSPLSKELIRKKKVVPNLFSNQLDLSSIRQERTTLMERDLSAVPTAFEMLGVTEEEDESNTRDLANLVKASSQDVSQMESTLLLSSNNSTLDGDASENQLSFFQEPLDTTSGDLSILSKRPTEQVSVIDLLSESDSSEETKSSESSNEADERLKGMIHNYVEHCSQYSQEDPPSAKAADDDKLFDNSPQIQPEQDGAKLFPIQTIESPESDNNELNFPSPVQSPPLSQSSSRHRTLLVALEEELAYSEAGQTILNSIRPLYVIGPYIRSPVHGVCLVMRQVDDVNLLICLNIGVCADSRLHHTCYRWKRDDLTNQKEWVAGRTENDSILSRAIT